jgi:hypothetical protein
VGVAQAATPDAALANDALPSHSFPPLAGKVIGVLVSGGGELLLAEGRRGPADSLCFSSGGASYLWVYVPVAKNPRIGGLNVPVGEKGQSLRRFNSLSLASPKTVQQWGVSEPYSLIEVEVNGGQGGPAADHFVATGMKVLDGTGDYPLKVTQVLADLRKCFHVHVEEQQTAIETALVEAREGLTADRRPTGKRDKQELAYVTWFPDAEQLRVVLQARVSERALGPILKPPPSPPAKGGDSDGDAPPQDHRPVTIYGVELAVAYDVSKDGGLLRSRAQALQTFRKEQILPVPAPGK